MIKTKKTKMRKKKKQRVSTKGVRNTVRNGSLHGKTQMERKR